MTEERVPYQYDETPNDTLVDQRRLPIFIHSQIDDMTALTPNAMRVYMHLARRAGISGVAWPSYQSIGDHCFGCLEKLKPASRRFFARRAIDELIDAKLIRKESRVSEKGDPTSNSYILLDPPSTPLPSAYISTPYAYISTKGTPLEGTPIEETKNSSNRRSMKDSPKSPSLDQDVDFDMDKKRVKRPNPAIHSTDQPVPDPVRKPSRPLPVPDPDYDPDKTWDSIPSASEGRPLIQGVLEETNEFARQYRLLDKCNDTVRRVSFLVRTYTGFKPTGTKQAWVRQIEDLWKDADQKESVLIAGLIKGQEAREKNPNYAFSGPRSFGAYVRNAEAKPVKTVARRSNSNPSRHGQTVQQVGGRTVVTMT